MELRVLGPIEVRRDGVVVPLPGGKQRAVLARLAVDAGQVVSVDALTDALWGDDPPPTAAGTVQVHVSNLRRILGAAAIVTRAPGYLLPIEGVDLDHEVLEQAVTQARSSRAVGRAADALERLEPALGLVRGEPYAEVAFEPWAQAEVRRLAGLVLAAREEVHAALLDLGQHQRALPRLQSLVEAHPFHERFRAQLMVALYRDGRQADALRCYQEGRSRLVEELGVDPGPELQQLEGRILAQDPTLDGPAAAPMRAAPDAPPPPGGTATALFGRDATLATLLDDWRATGGGDGRLAIVEGRPGMGKTAVAREVASRAQDDGAIVGTGAAQPLDGAPPFWPWVSALREVSTGPHGDALTEALASTPGSELLSAALTGEPVEEPSGPQFRLFDAGARVLTHLAAHRPVLLVLEDLHWADQATLDLLQFLVRARVHGHLLVLVTHRPVTADHSLAATLAGLLAESSVRRLVLEPLDVDAVQQMAEASTEGPVDHALAGSIAERTGGNPFWVGELIRQLRTPDGHLDASRTGVPDTVRTTIRQRAAGLGPDVVAVLEICSTAGGEFSDVIPQDVLGPDVDVIGALDGAVAEGLVVEALGRPGFYRFSHDIVRHALYDALPQRRRAEMHVAVARAIEARADGSTRWAWALAAHYAQGIDLGTAREAVHWQRQAAAQAARAQAYTDAVRHLRRALFVIRTRIKDDRAECEALIELAGAARLAADPGTAAPARERARRLAERLGDDALLIRATNVLLGPGPHWVRRSR